MTEHRESPMEFLKWYWQNWDKTDTALCIIIAGAITVWAAGF